MKSFLLVLVMSLFTGLPLAFSQDTTYVDSEGNFCSPENAKYYRIGREDTRGYTVSEFHIINRVLVAEGSFQSSKQEIRTGIWRFYDDSTGVKQREASYFEGVQNGLETGWYASGQIRYEWSISGDHYEGAYRRWHGNGQRHVEMQYDQSGKPLGKGMRWRLDGTLAEEWSYGAGGRDEVQFFYPDGSQQLIGYANQGESLHIESAWDSLGHPVVTNGEGQWKWQTLDGLPVAAGGYKKGLPEGAWTFYHLHDDQRGTVQLQGTFKKGKAADLWTLYDFMGQVIIEVPGKVIGPVLQARVERKTVQPIEQEPAAMNIDKVKTAIGYPKWAKKEGVQGQIMLRCLMNKEGRVDTIKVTQSLHPDLDRLVIEQTQNFIAMSPVSEDRVIAFWLSIPFGFLLLD